MADAGVAGVVGEGDDGTISGLRFDHLRVVMRESESGGSFCGLIVLALDAAVYH